MRFSRTESISTLTRFGCSIMNVLVYLVQPFIGIGILKDLFYGRSYSAGSGELFNSRLCLMKNPMLYGAGRPESGREARERFLMAPLARIQSERRRRLAL